MLGECVISIPSATVIDAEAIVARLGNSLIVKPENSGSSVGLHLIDGVESLTQCIKNLTTGKWLVEPRFVGRELTVGILHGEPMGIVEIVADSGVYDYAHKYQPGKTTYRFPAPLPESVAEAVKQAAGKVFKACGCRDFARADFLYNEKDGFIFLEINTIPGLTDTSLLPKSASCLGYDFKELCKRMLAPAIERFQPPLTL